jgi:hypothetical protein
MEGLLPAGANSAGLAGTGQVDATPDTGDPTQALVFSDNYSFALTTAISPYERHLPPSTADDIFVELG